MSVVHENKPQTLKSLLLLTVRLLLATYHGYTHTYAHNNSILMSTQGRARPRGKKKVRLQKWFLEYTKANPSTVNPISLLLFCAHPQGCQFNLALFFCIAPSGEKNTSSLLQLCSFICTIFLSLVAPRVGRDCRVLLHIENRLSSSPIIPPRSQPTTSMTSRDLRESSHPWRVPSQCHQPCRRHLVQTLVVKSWQM